MSRPSNWLTPTTAIRIPAHLAGLLVSYAKQLESYECGDPLNDGYYIGQKVYHKTWKAHPAYGYGYIEHLTLYTVYVLWVGLDESKPITNWKELAPEPFGRRFCTKYLIPVDEPIQLSIA